MQFTNFEDFDMKRTAFVLIVLGIAVFPFNGCTMLGMHGMGHDSAQQEHRLGKKLISELQNDDATITVELPILLAGQESTISVSVRDTKSGQPISGAYITVLIERIEERSIQRDEPHEIIISERLLEESKERGIYRLSHSLDKHGMHEITVKVWVSNNDRAAPPLVISTMHEVVPRESPMGHIGITSMTVLGGMAMALLMVVMMSGSYH